MANFANWLNAVLLIALPLVILTILVLHLKREYGQVTVMDFIVSIGISFFPIINIAFALLVLAEIIGRNYPKIFDKKLF